MRIQKRHPSKGFRVPMPSLYVILKLYGSHCLPIEIIGYALPIQYYNYYL